MLLYRCNVDIPKMDKIFQNMDTLLIDYNANANTDPCLRLQIWFRNIMANFKFKNTKTLFKS